MDFWSIFIWIVWIALSILMSIQESKRKSIHLIVVLILCIVVTPVVAYLICRFLPDRYPIGCSHCDNKYNEAAYCGLCGKNIIGETKIGFVEKK